MAKTNSFTVGVSNFFIVEDKEGLIMVDTGCGSSREPYEKAFSDLGIDPTRIRLIVITHGHWDHYARALELKELTEAPVLCHKNAAKTLETAQDPEYVSRGELGNEFVKALSGSVVPDASPVVPDIVIDSDFDLNPYGVAGKIIYTPGHSECSMSVVLDSGEAFLGDIVINHPLNGEMCLAIFATDEEKLVSSLKTLLATSEVFYSGHGGPFTKEQLMNLL